MSDLPQDPYHYAVIARALRLIDEELVLFAAQLELVDGIHERHLLGAENRGDAGHGAGRVDARGRVGAGHCQ